MPPPGQPFLGAVHPEEVGLGCISRPLWSADGSGLHPWGRLGRHAGHGRLRTPSRGDGRGTTHPLLPAARGARDGRVAVDPLVAAPPLVLIPCRSTPPLADSGCSVSLLGD